MSDLTKKEENNTTQLPHQESEIDLIDLFRGFASAIARFFKFLGSQINNLIYFIIRNFFILTGSLLIGLIVSLYLSRTQAPVFTGEFVIRNNAIEISELYHHLDRLGNLTKSGFEKVFYNELNLEKENHNLLGLDVFWVIDLADDNIPDFIDYEKKHDVLDTVNVIMRDRVAIRMIGNDFAKFGLYRDRIIDYLNTEEKFVFQNEIRISQGNERKERVGIEINLLDSLQKVKYFEEYRRYESLPGQVLFMQDNSTQLLHEDILDLYERKFNIEKNLEIYPEIVTLLNDLEISPRLNILMYYFFRSSGLALLLTIVVLIFIRNYSSLKNLYKRK